MRKISQRLIDRNGKIIRQIYSEMAALGHWVSSPERKSITFSERAFSLNPPNLETFVQFFAAVRKAFPDYYLTIDRLNVQGNRVLVRYIIYGTHMGYFIDIAPTNEKMSLTVIDIFRLAKGKVIQQCNAGFQMNAIGGRKLESPVRLVDMVEV